MSRQAQLVLGRGRNSGLGFRARAAAILLGGLVMTMGQATVTGADALAALQRVYCNPLSLPLQTGQAAGTAAGTGTGRTGRPRGGSLADPTVIRHQGKYYLYATGGAAWVSSDLIRWQHHPVALPDQGRMTAPSIVEHEGTFYAIGNECILYRSRDPLGPWESLGHVKDEGGQDVHWADWMLFLDDDGAMYAYHNSGAGIGTDGIFVTRMDPKSAFARTLGPTVNCFAFNPEHQWEHRGEKNEIPDGSWLEAAWMTKHNGRYYLQYSAPGTEYTTYAVGVYEATSPMGPFTYDPGSPILRGQGFLNGSGHHAVLEGPDGQLWTLYHILVGNASKWERRLALDRVFFDDAGRMRMSGPTEVPQWGPLAKDRGDAGMSALSARAGAKYQCDSALAGHAAEQAFDGNIRSWWESEAAEGDHWLSVDLGEVHQVRSVRCIFYHAGPFAYRIEASADGRQWTKVVDQPAATLAENNVFATFAPTAARHVRLTITGRPEGVPVRVIELTVFGSNSGN